jgi:hypothetical protein
VKTYLRFVVAGGWLLIAAVAAIFPAAGLVLFRAAVYGGVLILLPWVALASAGALFPPARPVPFMLAPIRLLPLCALAASAAAAGLVMSGSEVGF